MFRKSVSEIMRIEERMLWKEECQRLLERNELLEKQLKGAQEHFLEMEKIAKYSYCPECGCDLKNFKGGKTE